MTILVPSVKDKEERKWFYFTPGIRALKKF
jgi:hypothetical protein